jgi:hypothetical protein
MPRVRAGIAHLRASKTSGAKAGRHMKPNAGNGNPTLRDRALAYAAHGVPIFPCVPGGKTPLTHNGFHDATSDPDAITAWWTRHPNANIATPTGSPGIDVLDVDVRANGSGWHAFNKAKRAGLLHGWLRAVETPSGGLHMHYPGTVQRNGSIRSQHLDFRAAGGYVLLPPSLGQTKTYSRRYTVLRNRPGPGRPLDWPAIIALLEPAAPARQSPSSIGRNTVEWLAAHVARQVEGNRDNALFWAACRAAETPAADTEPLIAAAVQAGLPEQQARRTVRSAYDRVTRQAATYVATPIRPTRRPPAR